MPYKDKGAGRVIVHGTLVEVDKDGAFWILAAFFCFVRGSIA